MPSFSSKPSTPRRRSTVPPTFSIRVPSSGDTRFVNSPTENWFGRSPAAEIIRANAGYNSSRSMNLAVKSHLVKRIRSSIGMEQVRILKRGDSSISYSIKEKYYAGPGFVSSPQPSSLPYPSSFLNIKQHQQQKVMCKV